jgi:hypothetical protein
VEEWDSHWQRMYHFKELIALPSNALLTLTAHYDNSQSNPENPNFPPKLVRYGERTVDETCLAYVKYTVDSESRELSRPQIVDVAIDTGGQLLVRGKGFRSGANIEVDAARLADTRNHKRKTGKRLLSSNDWRTLIPTGRQVTITVFNPDGVRSSPLTFSR